MAKKLNVPKIKENIKRLKRETYTPVVQIISWASSITMSIVLVAEPVKSPARTRTA